MVFHVRNNNLVNEMVQMLIMKNNTEDGTKLIEGKRI